MAELLIEQWIYRYAVRSGFSRLLSENEQLFRKYSIPDLDIVVAALKAIVERDRFERYDLARELIAAINDSHSQGVFENEADFRRLIFLLKFVHILKLIGNYSVGHVTQLMNEYFGRGNGGNAEFDSQKLQTALVDASFAECRKFVLNLLIREDRQVHFRTHKFPVNFGHVIREIKLVVMRLVEKLCDRSPPCELEQYERGEIPAVDHDDPSIALFYEYFKPGEKLDENRLADFLKTLTCSQISVSPPKFVKNVQTSNSRGKKSNAEESARRRRNGKRRDSGESAFTKVTTISYDHQPPPHHYHLRPISTSLPGGTKEKDGSDLLFPSLDALLSQRAESRLSKISAISTTKPFSINLQRLSEDEIQELTKRIKA